MNVRTDHLYAACATAAALLLVIAAGCVTVNVTAPGNATAASPPLSPAATATGPAPVLAATPAGPGLPSAHATEAASGEAANRSAPPAGTGLSHPNETPAAANLSAITSDALVGETATYSKYDIIRRFEEVAIGNEEDYLARWDQPLIKIGITGDYTPEDIATLNTFANRFNNVSETSSMTPVYRDGNQLITIHFVPPSYFDAVQESSVNKIYRDAETGEILFVDQTDYNPYVSRDNIYINAQESGSERNYELLRGLLYDIGFEGYTGDPQSIFYYDARSANMSRMDWNVVGLMYSRKFYHGETIGQAIASLG